MDICFLKLLRKMVLMPMDFKPLSIYLQRTILRQPILFQRSVKVKKGDSETLLTLGKDQIGDKLFLQESKIWSI